MSYNSQWGQDLFLDKEIFKGYRNGIFVDVGAHDGVTINNTLFFEKERGWTGINCEPLPEVFSKLQHNRPNCENLNVAINETDGTAEFMYNNGYTEMLSGLVNHYDKRHTDRLNHEIKHMGGCTQIIHVNTKKLSTVFTEKSITHVNYLSIDVEGAEYAVIKSIDFDKVFIDVIEFENNYNDTSLPIIEYLQTKEYKVVKYGPDIFMIHNKSIFKP
jgi:FkbM family methyltransferase